MTRSDVRAITAAMILPWLIPLTALITPPAHATSFCLIGDRAGTSIDESASCSRSNPPVWVPTFHTTNRIGGMVR